MTNKFILRAAGASLAAIISLAAQPLKAQAASDEDRIAKLERAVEALQQQNADLRAEVNSLKGHSMSSPIIEGKTKTQVTSDGKNYVETVVPASALESAEKWKLAPWLTELEIFGDLRLRYEYRGGQLPAPVHLTQMIGRSSSVNAIVFAWDFVERFWMIGSLVFV